MAVGMISVSKTVLDVLVGLFGLASSSSSIEGSADSAAHTKEGWACTQAPGFVILSLSLLGKGV